MFLNDTNKLIQIVNVDPLASFMLSITKTRLVTLIKQSPYFKIDDK